jgi:alpha-beta hydrolase superfamily lysophospholipase
MEEGKKIKLETYRQNTKGKAIGIIFMFHGLNSYMGHGAHLAHYFC